MIRFPKTYADRVAKLRVPSGFLIVAVFAWYSEPTARSLAFGLPVAFLGLALRAWAAGHLLKNRLLATGGPFAYTRNPLYLGTLLVAAGLTIASRSLGLGMLFAAVFVFIYLPVIQLEEQHLRAIFPEYAAYAERVPPLWPHLKPRVSRGAATPGAALSGEPGAALPGAALSGAPAGAALPAAAPENRRTFRAALYVKNQEYNAGAGFAAGVLFLLWKMRG